METILYAALGLALPAVVGVTLARALVPATAGGTLAEWLGYGWLLGVAASSAFMHLIPLAVSGAAWATAAALLVLGVGMLNAGRGKNVPPEQNRGSSHRMVWLLACLVSTIFIVTAALLAVEIVNRPTYPWDAWSSWAYKAKAWYLAGVRPEFVDVREWRQAGAPDTYSVMGAHYPTLIAAYQVYLAAWLGAWKEPWLNLPWLLCYLSLYAVVFGESRRLTGNATLALTAAGALTSLPFLTTHVALAGYMDLWLATALLAFAVSVVRLSEDFNARSFLLSALLAFVCIGLKVEGLIWVALIGAAYGVSTLRKTGFQASKGPLTLGLTAALGIGLVLAVILAVWAETRIVFPVLSNKTIGVELNDESLAIIQSLFLSWNWHLLFYLFALTGIGSYFLAGRKRRSRLWGPIALIGVLALAGLFFLVSINQASVGITNVNRLLLHWVPVFGLYIISIFAAVRGTSDLT